MNEERSEEVGIRSFYTMEFGKSTEAYCHFVCLNLFYSFLKIGILSQIY